SDLNSFSEKGDISDKRLNISEAGTSLTEISFAPRMSLCWAVAPTTRKFFSNNFNSTGNLACSCPHSGNEVCPSPTLRVSLIRSIRISFSVLCGKSFRSEEHRSELQSREN